MRLDRLRDRFFEGAPRYRWQETAGRGGMGVVFKALDLDLDEVVAIKVLSPDLEYDEQELLTRFKREINLNRKIKHPNVARIHDFGTSGDFPYITMEYVSGVDLRTLIQRKGRLGPDDAIAILRQIALGTEAAHRLGIVHRDLKSQNVMVDDSGAVAILDFGLARGKRGDNVTLDSIMIGTPHYMAPEQALGKPTDHRVDIYSIGVMAFEALTGRVPYTGEAPLAIAMRHVSEPIPEDLSRLKDVSPELVQIVHRALAKNPDDRFATAAALEAELAMLRPAATVRAAAAEGTAEAAPAGPPFQTVRLGTENLETQILTRQTEAQQPERADTAPYTVPAELEPVLAPATTTTRPVKTHEPTVLLVEGDAVQRALVGGYIEQFGCRTRRAGSGQEALELLMSEPVDLLLMDVQLPGMDGFDVTRVLKAQSVTASIPIVLMSARMDRNRFAFGIQSGATDFLTKPLALEAMIVRVWNILQHHGFVPPSSNEPLREILKSAPPAFTPVPAAGHGPK